MDFKHTLRQSTAYIADILAPNRCPCCSGFIKWDELLCNTCKNSLEPADDTSLPTPEGCIRALSAFRFKDPARQGIYSLKDGFGRNFARFTARILSESLDPSRFDLISCVPSYLERGSMKLRGHAETFARELSMITSLPCDVGLLYRKDTESKLHSGMSASERRECVKTRTWCGIRSAGLSTSGSI